MVGLFNDPAELDSVGLLVRLVSEMRDPKTRKDRDEDFYGEWSTKTLTPSVMALKSLPPVDVILKEFFF